MLFRSPQIYRKIDSLTSRLTSEFNAYCEANDHSARIVSCGSMWQIFFADEALSDFEYKGKEADVAFVVVAVNALSTLAMVVYPLICIWLGFSQTKTGIMLGATIHDVAQVVGAGYAVSEPVGNSAVIVKLFRVFLLLPVVLGIGYWFARGNAASNAAKIPAPVFAFFFLGLCLLNSIIPSLGLGPIYAPIRTALIEISNWGLLIAIGALGLGTSIAAIAALGMRHVATVVGTTLVILVLVTAGLFVVG